MTMGPAIALGVTVLLAWGGTWWIRAYAVRRALIDVPNHRSSHAHPTPRGGGVAMVVAWVVCLLWLAWQGEVVVPWTALVAVCGVALIGFVDDHRSVSAWARLGAHAAAGGLVVWSVGGVPIPGLGVVVGGLIGIWLVAWWINLTNFMDGIDGLASLHVVAVCGGGVLCYLAVGVEDSRLLPGLALAAASCGFLIWNWPPARIFMGDAGSGFLGAATAVCTLQAGQVAPALFWAWVVLAGTFVVDATVTLIARALRREALIEAHRTHAYQRLVRRVGGHRPVTLGWTVTTVVWLWPWAVGVARGDVSGPTGLALAWTPLALIVIGVGWWDGRTPAEVRDVA